MKALILALLFLATYAQAKQSSIGLGMVMDAVHSQAKRQERKELMVKVAKAQKFRKANVDALPTLIEVEKEIKAANEEKED